MAAFMLSLGTPLRSQPLAAPWGNLVGIEIQGQRMNFESSLRAVNPDWSGFVQSSKYNWEGTPSFTLQGKTYRCSHFLMGTKLDYVTKITDTGRGRARVDLRVELGAKLPMAGAYFCIDLPARDYLGARIEWIGADSQPVGVLANHPGSMDAIAQLRAKGFRVVGAHRSIEVIADRPTTLILRQNFVDQPAYLNDPHPRLRFVRSDPKLPDADFQVYFQVLPESARPGARSETSYAIGVNGTIDTSPVTFGLDPLKPGRRFDGIGGNLRMQYPELDDQVVDYCLANLKVRWARIALLWDQWQPTEDGNAAAQILSGRASPHLYRQIAIARKLAARHIPLIASVWVPPDWAVDHSRRLEKGVALDDAKLGKIADSIADFLVFLKDHYGIEVRLFSFNEPDYGVEVHQSSAEHARANRALGEAFAIHGLVTKLLLGDTGAGTSAANHLVDATVADPGIWRFLGAVSFHSYHGVTADDLKCSLASAKTTNLPLMLTEGGCDSAAHRYPLAWVTPWIAQSEIDEYVRSGSVGQVSTIMPWQLNADYSLLAGGGIYGDNGPLRPTQRFWCLKQLGEVPDAFWLPLSCDKPDITCAALGDSAGGRYALHLVNNGATRMATVTGLPASVHHVAVYVTDATRGMQLMAVKGVVDGTTHFQLEAQSFTSLISEPGNPQ